MFEDQLPIQTYEELIKQENVLAFPKLVGSDIIGGRMAYGKGNNTMKFDSALGLWLGNAVFSSAPFRVNMEGAIWASDITITGGTISNIELEDLKAGSLISIQGWQFSGTFSATDYRIVAWTAGTITLMDGTTFSISSGNTGNMSALTYIYFDKSASETVLQKSTTASDAVGANKILICVAQNNTDTDKKAIFQVFGGSGGMNPLITVDNIAANAVTANEIAANTITSGQITTGELITLSAQIKDGIITNAKIGNLAVDNAKIANGTIENAKIKDATIESAKIKTVDADTITAGTLTGRTVRTAASGARVEIRGSDNDIRVHDASNVRMHLDKQYLTFTGGATGDGVQLSQSGYRQLTIETPVNEIIFNTGGLEVQGDVQPIAAGYDLGGSTSSRKWRDIRLSRDIWADNDANIGRDVNAVRDLNAGRDVSAVQDLKAGRNLYIKPGTTATASAGTFYFDSSTNTLRYYNGTAWKTVATT
jgi:hypothetical protein